MCDFEITIPADQDGYILLKCPKCNEFFKVSANDYDSDDVVDIYCPQCGLISDSYLTDDVIDLAQSKMHNYALNIINNELDKLKKSTKSSFLKIETSKLKKKHEIELTSSIDALEIKKFNCCNKTAKIRELLSFCGGYCPFCGGIQDEDI